MIVCAKGCVSIPVEITGAKSHEFCIGSWIIEFHRPVNPGYSFYFR